MQCRLCTDEVFSDTGDLCPDHQHVADEANASSAENIWAEEHGIPTRFELARDLLECPGKIAEAEERLHSVKLAVAFAKDDLALKETCILLETDDDGNPLINGKNEAIRQAQITERTIPLRAAVRVAEAALFAAEHDYNLQVNYFRALRSVAALIAEEER